MVSSEWGMLTFPIRYSLFALSLTRYSSTPPKHR
jgi:hypothetical protein